MLLLSLCLFSLTVKWSNLLFVTRWESDYQKIAALTTYNHTLHKRTQLIRDGPRLNYNANVLPANANVLQWQAFGLQL